MEQVTREKAEEKTTNTKEALALQVKLFQIEILKQVT